MSAASPAGSVLENVKFVTRIDALTKEQHGRFDEWPIVVTSEVNSITHPEHGDVIVLPIGCYAFPGQRAFADELRRAAD